MEFQEHYLPLIAAPFRDREIYREVLPQPALRPWIRCFWEFRGGEVRTLVTPDTCMDIIFRADFTDHKLESSFCGIDDRTFGSPDKRPEEKTVFTFAIRFYAWGAYRFAEESMRDTKNAFFDAGFHFPQN